MDYSHLIRRLNEEKSEEDKDKASQETVLYMTPDMLDKSGESGPGARCGKCMFFRAGTSECLLTDPPACDAEHGVCGLFVGGKSIFTDDMTPTKAVPKTAAGYMKDEKAVPTFCGKCEYFLRDENRCRMVRDEVHEHGCCNAYDYEDKSPE
jgi:hypothetical protein